MSAGKPNPNAITPTSRPTAAFTARSMLPPRPMCLPLRSSLSIVNSSPRKKRRKMIPSSATKVVTSDGSIRLVTCGSCGPSSSPARR
jgi:hypothetical protein